MLKELSFKVVGTGEVSHEIAITQDPERSMTVLWERGCWKIYAK